MPVERRQNPKTIIKAILRDARILTEPELQRRCMERGMSEEDFKKALARLDVVGQIVRNNEGMWKLEWAIH